MDLIMTMTGTSELLMHNSQMVDPLNTWSQSFNEVKGKRKKTDADHEVMARIEFFAGLYIGPEGPYLPGANILSCLAMAGGRQNKGALVKRSVLVPTDQNLLAYKGPRTAEELYADANFVHRAVANGNPSASKSSKIMRTRPIFRQWACQATLALDTHELNLEDLRTIADDAGRYTAIGDWRPRYGRFTVTLEPAGR